MKGRSRHIPLQNDTVAMFVQGHVTVFLYLCDEASKERHKVTTRICTPQKKVYSSHLCSWDVVRRLYFFTRRPQIWYDIRYRYYIRYSYIDNRRYLR